MWEEHPTAAIAQRDALLPADRDEEVPRDGPEERSHFERHASGLDRVPREVDLETAVFKPSVKVPCAISRPWVFRSAKRRHVGRMERNLSNRTLTHTDIPYMPLGISLGGGGAVTMPGKALQVQAGL